MRIYISDGRVFAVLDETIEICKFDNLDTLQKYKERLLKKISDRFDWTVTEAALKGMETYSETDEGVKALPEEEENVAGQPELSAKEPEPLPDSCEDADAQPTELFRAPKEKMDQPKSRTGRQRLDYGKIMALHNAGWSNARIADEMGMTYSAVATAISTYKRKMRANCTK